jgi:hypothetical protein
MTKIHVSVCDKNSVFYFLFYEGKIHLAFSTWLFMLVVHLKKSLQNRDRNFPTSPSFSNLGVTRSQYG